MSSWDKKFFRGFTLIFDLILSFSRQLIAEGLTGGLVISQIIGMHGVRRNNPILFMSRCRLTN